MVDDADPLQQYRLQVVVPEIFGDASVWATASVTDWSVPLPTIGDLVWVSFEHGDSEYPVWQSDSVATDQPTRGYVGKYRGVVVDNDDPMQLNRLGVTVPEIDSTPAWAQPADGVSDIAAPDVGAEVWVEYDNGDPAYPRWVGLA